MKIGLRRPLAEPVEVSTAAEHAVAIAEHPWPHATSSRQNLVTRAGELLVGPRHVYKRTHRAVSVDRVLAWIETWPGSTWQQRWMASGAESQGRGWLDSAGPFILATFPAVRSLQAARLAAADGLKMLLCLRLLRPGYPFLITCHFRGTYEYLQQLIDPRFFAEANTIGHEQGIREDHRIQAVNHICRIIVHTGRDPRQLRPEDLLAYRAQILPDRHLNCLNVAWELLRETRVFPADTMSLRDARKQGQLSIAQLVDRYEVQSPAVREVLIRYLTTRAASIDYSSLMALVGNLVGVFWKDIEQHHPGIDTLHLTPAMAQAWRERALLRKRAQDKGTKRLDHYPMLFLVRSFYADITQWAMDDPYWADWVAPNPVRAEDVRGAMKHKRHRQARIHQRTRTLAPLLPQLVHSVETRLADIEQLYAAASRTPAGETFAVNDEQFERIQTKQDVGVGRLCGSGRLRVVRLSDGQRLDLTQDEDEAFWTWAMVETLRHTGVRIEEMLELTHLSLTTYRLPDSGEVVPLLQIAPSKMDTERVLLISPELAHVLARVVHRVRQGQEHIPLVTRYDHNECVVGAPLPHLFQRWYGTERRVISPGLVKRLLELALTRLALRGPNGELLRYTPHDFRRIFATDAVSAGLPIHIAAKLLGHLDLNTTQTYAAVYQDDVLRHHSAFITRRRAERPSEEYRQPTAGEWDEFQSHFTRRKVELGTCARPYGTPCRHEHACIRCPMLQPDPAQAMRLAQIITNLHERISEATDRGWLGEVDGLKVSLAGARQKLDQLRRLRTQTLLTIEPHRLT